VSAVTGDGVNCDSAEEVGAGIMTKLDDCVYSEVVMKKADTVKTLADIATVCAPRQKQLNLDNGLLFSRLLVICSRERDIESYFQYEMTSTPAALFKDGFMRKVDKAQLQHELLNTVDTSFMIIPRCVYVIDGRCLLHRVKWEKGATYAAIAQQYNQYVSKHYGVSTVVFDGYEASVKDHEHERRATKCAPNVVVDPGRNAYFDQGTFLANQENKKSFIDLLTKCLRDAGHSVHQASDDADTLLVHTALQCARQQRPVVVVANDTDVLVLLIYHIHVCAEPDSISDVYMLSEVTSRKIQPKMLIPVQRVVEALGPSVALVLPAIHALTGCDCTSALFGQGKRRALKRLTDKDNIPLLQVIGRVEATHEEVMSAGLSLLSCMYGGKATDNLNSLRYTSYYHLTTSSNCAVSPERLPPTRNAAKFHIFRAHLQALQWMTLMSTTAEPTDWDWKLCNGKFMPITTDSPVAPDNILNVVRCKCRVSTRRPCSSMLCSCRKHGLECVAACKDCHGTGCENVTVEDDMAV